MKSILLNNSNNSIVLQCACISHCSYIEYIWLSDNYLSNIFSSGDYIKKSDVKKIRKIENQFILSVNEQQDFAKFLDNTLSMPDNIFKHSSGISVKIDIIENTAGCKYDVFLISYYLNDKYLAKDKPSISMVITRKMYQRLVQKFNEKISDILVNKV